jgi:ADP-ribose pyrophosphatase
MEFDILERHARYHGRAFSVAQVQVRLPNGVVRPYDLVEHSDSVTIVPVDDEGHLWFVSQYRIGAGQRLLELPAGVLEDSEDARLAAERELREEIGYGAREWQVLGDFYLAPGYCTEHMVVFLARGLYRDPLQPDADEYLHVHPLTIHEAYQEATRGNIKDAKTLAALFLARPYLLPV